MKAVKLFIDQNQKSDYSKKIKTQNMKVTAVIETVTPFKAKEWLKQNENNRAINDSNVAFITNQILDGNYALTGESIKFSERGKLMDGQHRLLAVVKTGISVESLVVRGLKENTFAYIDTGRTRQAGDVLSIDGMQNANNIAAMVKFIMNYKTGGYSVAVSNGTGRGKKISNSDVLEFVRKHKNSLLQSYPYGFNKSNKVFPGSKLAGVHYLLKSKDAEKADEFCSRLCDGIFLKADSPIYMLRQRFIADQKNKQHMGTAEKFALILKAWNLYINNKTTTRLIWNSVQEPFPKI